MFREMRRFKQQVEIEQCQEVLKSEPRGILSVNGDDGYPYGIPVNFFYDETDNCIYLHGAKEGHKIDAIKASDKVCFTVYNQGFKKAGCWEWNPTSVICFGRASLIDDMDMIMDKVRKLGVKYYPNEELVDEEMAQSAHHVQLIQIKIEHMTGKLVNEK